MYRLAVFASGSGSNAEEIFKHFQHHPSIRVKALLCNNPKAMVLQRAEKFDIEVKLFTREEFQQKVAAWLQEKNITHVILAGFLWLLPEQLIKAYPDKIVNIHPALLPKYGGKGMYGLNVHTAVKQANEFETGITIHLVNERYDEGRVLFQATCSLAQTDTPEDIANRVHFLEHKHYPTVIERWILETVS